MLSQGIFGNSHLCQMEGIMSPVDSTKDRWKCMNSQADLTMAAGLTLLDNRSNEFQITTKLINTCILPKLGNKKYFLDIGAGFGRFSLEIGKKFTTTSIIEPNQMLHRQLLKKLKGKVEINRSIQIPLENVKFEKEEKYDLILLSHILYYIPPELWFGEIQKLLNILHPKGLLIIILWSPKSQAYEYSSKLSPTLKNIHSQYLLETLKVHGMKPQVISTKPWIKLRTLSEVKKLFEFLTLNNKLAPMLLNHQSKMLEILEITQRNGRGYLVWNNQDIIVVGNKTDGF